MLMVFLLIMPGVMSGLGNLLVPIQLCVPEMVFPKVNNLGTPAGVTCRGHYMVLCTSCGGT
jgi:heme/copper-type cytochrome/quinol oxidase subunit 1